MQERELASKHQVLLEKQPQASRAEEGASVLKCGHDSAGHAGCVGARKPVTDNSRGGMAQCTIRDVLNASFG